MRILFICLLTALIVSCSTRGQSPSETFQVMPDTVYVEVPTLNDERIKELEADVVFWKNVADSVSTTIPYEDYMNARRVEKIKYYISITEKNSNNKKFFYGWIKRTMSEQ